MDSRSLTLHEAGHCVAFKGVSHVAAQIIDLVFLAAIVKENKTFKRALEEFNMVQNMTAK